MSKKQNRLSQCMIVKNEEKNIERALSWGKDIMWEQIVVDTGSSDRTVEIAEKMGAKVFHFEWMDDFAAAKNYAIEQAGGDWIIFLDADEYLIPEDTKKLILLLESADNKYNVLISSLKNLTDWDQLNSLYWHKEKQGVYEMPPMIRADNHRFIVLVGVHARIFRRAAGFSYQGRIHEELYNEKGILSFLDVSNELTVFHTGYIESEIRKKNKKERNRELFKKELEEHPDNYAMLVCLGNSYLESEDYLEAVHYYEEAVNHMPQGLTEENVPDAAVFKNLIAVYFMWLSDEVSAQKAYERAVKCFPKEADYDYLMGKLYADSGRFEEGAVHLQRAISLMENYGVGMLLEHNLMDAWESLVQCCYEMGDVQSCIRYAVVVLKADRWRQETLKIMLQLFRNDKERSQSAREDSAASASQVKMFLSNIYDFSLPSDKEFVLSISEKAGYDELSREFL